MYCPTYAELKLAGCPEPPSKFIVQQTLREVLNEGAVNLALEDANAAAPYFKLAAELGTKTADKKWMLDVLSTLTQGRHEFFAKNYVAPKRNQIVLDNSLADNADDFLTGLPESTSKSKSRRGAMMLMNTL